MNDEIKELYQQVILDHNKNPRNFGTPDSCSHDANGHNPLCGDTVHVYLTVNNGVIEDAHFKGAGCAISKASASIMTDIVRGKSVEEAKKLFEAFHKLIVDDSIEPDVDVYGKLAVFAGVREFPSRVKCASLAWHTMQAAIDNTNEVTTE